MRRPFRWDITKREQLGKLLTAASPKPFPEDYMSALRETAARVLALGNDADFAFIGRTPENFFDYLSGVFHGIDEAPAVHIVQFSLRWAGPGGVESIPSAKRNGFFDYLTDEGVDPAAIASGSRPLALVDFVVDGGTMENFVALLRLQASRDGIDWNAVQRRLVIIGLRIRTKNSPNTWRWQQNRAWLDQIPDTVIRNVSAPMKFLIYLGNHQAKVTSAHTPEFWDRFSRRKDTMGAAKADALHTAIRLFDAGRTKVERRALAALIAKTHQIRQPATRRMILALRKQSADH
jgi:hypothetical protein